MATIQVRDVPDETYEFYRRRAEAAGQSLQSYMRDQLVDTARTESRKEQAIRDLESRLAAHGGLGHTADEIVAILHAERR